MLWQKIRHGINSQNQIWLFEVALRLSQNCAFVQSLYWIVIRRECDCCEITSKLRLFWDEKAIIYMVARFYWDCREIRLLQDWRLWDCDGRLFWDQIGDCEEVRLLRDVGKWRHRSPVSGAGFTQTRILEVEYFIQTRNLEYSEYSLCQKNFMLGPSQLGRNFFTVAMVVVNVMVRSVCNASSINCSFSPHC